MYKIKKETASMTTSAGWQLDADIYRPDSQEKFPVLLMRQPYGRAIASTVVYAHPSWYAAQGYIVVIQDVRGRGTSQGTFELFSNEIEDGLETVNWASQLEGSTGDVGMYGFSYQGMTQLYTAATKPSCLKVICPAMIAYDIYSDWAYENGAFCLQNNLGWAVQLAAETARLSQDSIAYQILHNASRNLPFDHPSSIFVETLRKYSPSNFYFQWLEHSSPDQHWQKLSPKSFIKNLDLPMLHIGGWFDPYLRGTLNLYKEMKTLSQFPQHLIIGPWAHLPWGRKLAMIDYGSQANSPVDQLQIEWFNYFLKGINSEIFNQPPVCLFEMGSNQWRYFDSFPENNQQSYYLITNGLANIRDDGGKLVKESVAERSFDILIHDPWRPVPSLGGHASIPAGAFERSHIDCRSDVLTYTSEPLNDDLFLVGNIELEIYCNTDALSFDICAVLSQVFFDSSIYNFTQGYIRVNLDSPSSSIFKEETANKIILSLQPTCIKIAQGNCLRLSISATCFPAYTVNLGKLVSLESNLIDAQIITLKLNFGNNYPCKILLPCNP